MMMTVWQIDDAVKEGEEKDAQEQNIFTMTWDNDMVLKHFLLWTWLKMEVFVV